METGEAIGWRPHDRITFTKDRCSTFLNVRVSENSPSRWPTMFSVTNTGLKILPLCTANVSPTKSGVIIDRRDQVLIGVF